ncbi:MAG: aminopeptidase [Bacteroidales bacterium]|nr:aminopeptidase [Bacteroidales bacterium]
MRKSFLSTRTALSLVLSFILPLQMLATELGEAGKRLAALPGVSNVETLESVHFPEKYVFFIRQQLDAKDASKGDFDQRVVLCHRGFDRPTVFVTEGYNGRYALYSNYIEELAKLFDTNIILAEYRYFDKSMPKERNWDYLTVENSLYDLHHINETLRAMYNGKWISTGISKGGQTTMFYRSYFPDDVDISVPYVAPLNRALEDVRPEIFINDKVSTKENRQKVIDFQTLLFERKAALMPLMEKYCKEMKYTFKEPLENVFDFCVLEYSFAFWQWGYNVDRIPTREATDEQLFGYLMGISEPSYFTNQTGNVSFNVQAARELGYYGYYTKPFKKYLSIKTSKGYLKRLMLPTDAEDIKFSSELYKHTVSFLSKNDPKMIYIYGEQDPWTATGIYGLPLTKDKENLHVYLCKGGSHYTRIKSFPEETQQEIIQLINKWLQE